MDKRDLLLNLMAKDGISPVAKKAGDAIEDLGKDFKATQDDARRLDTQLGQAQEGLEELAVRFARAEDAAERMDLVSAMRKQTAEIRRLSKAKDLLPDFDKLGSEAAEGFGVSFVGRLGPLMAKAPLGPVGAALGAIIGPVVAAQVGALVGGAVLGGIGIGGVVGGLALAAKDARVKAAGGDLKKAIMGDLEDFSKVFVGPAVEGIRIVRGAWGEVTDEVQESFGAASKYVTPLARGVAGFLTSVAPGIRDAMKAAAPVIREISTGLPKIGDAISDVLKDLSGDADEAATGVRGLLMGLESGIRITGGFVSGLMDIYGGFVKAGQAGAHFAEGIAGWLPIVGSQLTNNREKMDELAGALDSSQPSWQAVETATTKVTGGAKKLTTQQTVLTGSMRDGIKAAGSLTDAFNLLNGKALSAREAESNFQEAIDDATASVKENGKTLNINTAAGRANDAALRSLIGSVDAKAQAVYDETLATKGQTAAENAAKAAYEQGRAQLIKSAMQMGLSKTAAEKYADKLMKIPKNWTTTVKAATEGASKKLETFQKEVNGLKGKTITITIKTNGDHYIPGVGTQLKGAAKGGPVVGRGPKGVDSVPMLLAPGEHVITAQEVDALGGHSNVEKLRASWRSGKPVAGTAGQAVSRPSAPRNNGGGNTYNVTVKAYSDKFNLNQVTSHLAMLGVH